MDRQAARELLKGAYDLHVHTAPSHFKRALDDFDLLYELEAQGMGGALIKSHYEPTQARALLANSRNDTSARLFGGIALNHPVGGLNPYAAESCLNMGGSIVWMPTRDAAHSLCFGNMPGDFFDRPGLTVLEADGTLKQAVYEIIEVVRKYGAYIATGHLSLPESRAVCHACIDMGVNCILTHPDWHRTQTSLQEQFEFAQAGILIEKVWATVADGDITAEALGHSVRVLGAENIFMTTDRGQAGMESPAEGMLRFVECMLGCGISHRDIQQMVLDNPRRIVQKR